MPLSNYSSISTKLSITTSLITAAVIAIVAVYIYIERSQRVINDQMMEVKMSMADKAMEINQRFREIELLTRSNEWLVNRYVHSRQNDSIFDVLSKMMVINHDINGCGVIYDIDATRPQYMAKILYVSRDGKISRPVPVNSASANWLKNVTGSSKSRWTGPTKAEDNDAYSMCSYSYPVAFNGPTPTILIKVDYPLALLSEIIEGERPAFIDRSYITDAQGNCIITPPTDPQGYNILNPNNILANYLDGLTTSKYEVHNGTITRYNYHDNTRSQSAFFLPFNNERWSLCYYLDQDQYSSPLVAASRYTILVFGITLVLLYLCISNVIKRITKPLHSFSLSALEISKGNFYCDLPEVKTHDEMALLYDSFEKMQRSLIKYTQDLEDSTRVQALMGTELQIASKIQDDLLPKEFPPFPERNDVNIAATLVAAKEIGGDLYNYFLLDDKLFFIIADVSGKGVPAAMVMAIANNVFEVRSPYAADPSEIVAALNATTCDKNQHSGFFITALVGILDLRTGQLRLCNAGHNPPLIVYPDGKAEALKLKPNLPIGVIKGYDYQSMIFDMPPKSTFLLYTDGVTEAENDTHQLFGLTRLLQGFEHMHSTNVDDIVDKVTSDVDDFAGDTQQSDDITVMAINFNPSEIPMPPPLVLTRSIDELEKVTNFSLKVAENAGLSEALSMKLNLALEEAITNIISYSFPKNGVFCITLFAAVYNDQLSIIIGDNGKKFDPTAVADADTNAPLEKRRVGGLGITLIRKIVDKMTYQRINNNNYLTLTIDLNHSDFPDAETA